MVEATPFLPGLSPVAGKPLTACRDGGNLTSNGGLIALREVARHLDIANVMAAPLPDARNPALILHTAVTCTDERLSTSLVSPFDIVSLPGFVSQWRRCKPTDCHCLQGVEHTFGDIFHVVAGLACLAHFFAEKTFVFLQFHDDGVPSFDLRKKPCVLDEYFCDCASLTFWRRHGSRNGVVGVAGGDSVGP